MRNLGWLTKKKFNSISKELILVFEKSNKSLTIPFTNDPIMLLRQRVISFLKEEEKKALGSFYYNRTTRSLYDLHEMKIETFDTQLSFHNLDEKLLMSRSILHLPFEQSVCVCEGYIKEFELGSYFVFDITNSLAECFAGLCYSDNGLLFYTKTP